MVGDVNGPHVVVPFGSGVANWVSMDVMVSCGFYSPPAAIQNLAKLTTLRLGVDARAHAFALEVLVGADLDGDGDIGSKRAGGGAGGGGKADDGDDVYQRKHGWRRGDDQRRKIISKGYVSAELLDILGFGNRDAKRPLYNLALGIKGNQKKKTASYLSSSVRRIHMCTLVLCLAGIVALTFFASRRFISRQPRGKNPYTRWIRPTPD